MSEKLIVAGVVLLILIVIIYMLHDSDLVRGARKMAESAANKRDEAKKRARLRLQMHRSSRSKSQVKRSIMKKRWTEGSAKSAGEIRIRLF